mmetsp:Transcript_4240/g.5588  ORF Transcript_4240/g.5588 Transcript_4240/m.5588 type:complete len:422 (+) Transcript_4240:59-1324(+)
MIPVNQYFVYVLGVVAVVVIAVAVPGLPRLLKWRDDAHFQPPFYSPQDLTALHACAGNVTVHLDNATLDRLESQMGGVRPVGTVRLFYITTRCQHRHGTNDENDDDENETTNSPNIASKEHILLSHGSGLSSKFFTSNLLGNQQETLWTQLLSASDNSFDLTAVDLRGHGLSEITKGPYNVELLGADLAAFVQEFSSLSNSSKNKNNNAKNQNRRVHCHGLSAGFGACMSMAIYDPDLVETLTGSGWLFDRSRFELLPYIFSRPLLNKLLGIQVIARLGQVVMRVQQHDWSRGGLLEHMMHHAHLDGFVSLASSWFQFNVSHALPTWTKIPTLFVLPEYDADVGFPRHLIEQEINLMPKSAAALGGERMGHIVEFAKHSHCMVGEPGGAAKMAKVVYEFITNSTLQKKKNNKLEQQQQNQD